MSEYTIRLSAESEKVSEVVIERKLNDFATVAQLATIVLYENKKADNVACFQHDPRTGEPFADYFFYAEKS